ncbi:probable alpha-mannosidase At5g66150 [Magnolia sinica]|uniref:probable alpha-mannosidase At5g66150 n=1 Tax=Magnolia sinica TaxID=86752 RepID=UPI002659D637|nr:probable alpha-mannosidase At5g66150 [Magnolia sinica]
MLSNHQIFTSAFPVHYSPPNGFHFEVNDESSPIQAVICLDGDGCKLRSGLVKIEEGLTLDTLIAYDSCDLWPLRYC